MLMRGINSAALFCPSYAYDKSKHAISMRLLRHFCLEMPVDIA
jgi:hypothetical protein